MHACAGDGGGYSGRQVSIADQANAGASLADAFDQVSMTRTFQNNDHQVIHAALEAAGDGLQIVLHRRIEIHRATGGWPHDDLIHIAIGRVKQTTLLGSGQDSNCAAGAGSAEVGPLERIDGNIDPGCVRLVLEHTHVLSDVEHGRLVPFAFTNDDRAMDRNAIHCRPHLLDRQPIGGFGVIESHGSGRRDGRLFHNTEKFKGKVEHKLPPRGAAIQPASLSQAKACATRPGDAHEHPLPQSAPNAAFPAALIAASSCCSRSRAAFWLADFLEDPLACALSSSPTRTSTVKVLEWSGPSTAIVL